MFDKFLQELGGRGLAVVVGLVIGSTHNWLLARWQRRRERQNILKGDARDTIIIALHLVEPIELPPANGAPARKAPGVLRVRSLGQSELNRVVPNGHLA